MGFLDKSIKAVTVAKAQVDGLRAARGSRSALPADAGPMDEHERGVLARAIEQGAPDPFTLLDRDEAATLLQARVGPATLTYSDDATGVEFDATGPHGRSWMVAVSVYHGGAPGDSGVAYWRDLIVGSYDGAESMHELGDEALWSPPFLFVRSRGTVFYVETRTAEPDGDREAAVTAARIVLERLPRT